MAARCARPRTRLRPGRRRSHVVIVAAQSELLPAGPAEPTKTIVDRPVEKLDPGPSGPLMLSIGVVWRNPLRPNRLPRHRRALRLNLEARVRRCRSMPGTCKLTENASAT